MGSYFGRSLLSGGSLLSGFTCGHKKLTLISGGGVATFGIYLRPQIKTLNSGGGESLLSGFT